MNQLVFKEKSQVVTSSRNIARDFEKGHREVLRAIDEIIKGGVVQNSADLFHESIYTHEQNKQQYRQYLMNRDGFTLLVMGFTGRKAMQFKMAYIKAFNEMEQRIKKPRVLSDKEQRIEMLKLSLELEEKSNQHDERITNLEETMRIDGAQEYTIKKKANRIVVEALGGKKSPAYKEMAFKVFSQFWRDFKNHFEIPRYGDLPKKRFEDGVRFIGMWQPSTSLKIDIDNANKQQSMQGVI